MVFHRAACIALARAEVERVGDIHRSGWLLTVAWRLSISLVCGSVSCAVVPADARSAKLGAGGETESVRTRFVAMELDHDTGDMDGEVLEGPYAGRRLSDLDIDALLEILNVSAGADTQSAQVLQSYLDRIYGDEWRDQAGAAGSRTGADDEGPRPGSGGMTRNEAYEVLGLGPGAGDEDIKQAHRRLIREYHPDKGGSDYLAAKINEAKELLLGR